MTSGVSYLHRFFFHHNFVSSAQDDFPADNLPSREQEIEMENTKKCKDTNTQRYKIRNRDILQFKNLAKSIWLGFKTS